jgi:hypothetical protein
VLINYLGGMRGRAEREVLLLSWSWRNKGRETERRDQNLIKRHDATTNNNNSNVPIHVK